VTESLLLFRCEATNKNPFHSCMHTSVSRIDGLMLAPLEADDGDVADRVFLPCGYSLQVRYDVTYNRFRLANTTMFWMKKKKYPIIYIVRATLTGTSRRDFVALEKIKWFEKMKSTIHLCSDVVAYLLSMVIRFHGWLWLMQQYNLL
jgi:hypothetical protein